MGKKDITPNMEVKVGEKIDGKEDITPNIEVKVGEKIDGEGGYNP